MKRRIIVLLLPLFLFGCSKQGPEAERHADIIQQPPVLPFPVTMVEPSEDKEFDAIRVQVLGLFRAGKYDDLERLAIKYRSSGECWADGGWKLGVIYGSIAFVDGSETDWKIQQKEIQIWMDARPLSLTARITMARFLRNYAWKAGEYADKVPAEDWRLFCERLHQAYKVLNDAKNLEQNDPVYWATTLEIAMGLQAPKATYDALFKQAIICQPHFEPFYEARAVSLLPRWHGKKGEWEKDLAHNADSIGGDNGDMLYAQVVWGMHANVSTDSGNIFEDDPELSWKRVDRGFAVILKRFPDSLSAKNERAHLAALAGDKDAARKYFTATQGNVDPGDWHAKGEFIESANWAFAP